MKKGMNYMIVFIVLIILPSLLAQENNSTNSTIDISSNTSSAETDNNSQPINSDSGLNETANETSQINQTLENQSLNLINESKPQLTDFEMVNLTPRTANKGNVLLGIEVKNKGNTKLTNLFPFVVARGFSTYDVTPIKELEPDAIGTAFVSGDFVEPGEVLLTIKINEKMFYDSIKIEEPKKIDDEKQKRLIEETKKKSLEELSNELNALKKNYKTIEDEFNSKKQSYDLSEIKLESLKKYVTDAQANIIAEDVQKANISLILGLNEYNDLNSKLSKSSKKSFLQKIRENILIISGVTAGLVSIITLYELLKKKKEGIYTTIKYTKKTENISGKAEETQSAKEGEGKKKETKQKLSRKIKQKIKRNNDETRIIYLFEKCKSLNLKSS